MALLKDISKYLFKGDKLMINGVGIKEEGIFKTAEPPINFNMPPRSHGQVMSDGLRVEPWQAEHTHYPHPPRSHGRDMSDATPQLQQGAVLSTPITLSRDTIDAWDSFLTSDQLDHVALDMISKDRCSVSQTPPPTKTFKVSDLIELRLERQFKSFPEVIAISRGGKLETNIYVKGKKFKQCKYLLIHLDASKTYEDIESIDDAVDKLDTSNTERDLESRGSSYRIPPETEFWGHASNLQAWVENDYNLSILHSNLSLPLLRELSNYDERAKIHLKEQIFERVEKGGYKAWKMYDGYRFSIFTIEELQTLLKIVKNDIITQFKEAKEISEMYTVRARLIAYFEKDEARMLWEMFCFNKDVKLHVKNVGG